ncbi:MAG: hypothetical protein AB7G93_20335 [Bdellovibrionales bacterium]
MKKLLLSAVLAFAGWSAGAQTYQTEAYTQPASCYMRFGIRIDSLLVASRGYGTGFVDCVGADNRVYAETPVTIEIEGIGPGLGSFSLQGYAFNLGILNPSEINGTYGVVQTNIGAGPAVGAALGFVGQQNGLSFTGQITAGSGVGIMLNGTKWDIRVAH